MIAWEYRVFLTEQGKSHEEWALNILGEDGWGLTAVDKQKNAESTFFYLKRQKV